MRKALSVLFIAFALCTVTVAPVALTGCQGTRTQQVLYITTDSVGKAVDTAVDAFNDYEVQKAKLALGANANAATVLNWMENDKTWKDMGALRDKFNAAYIAWCSGNAVAASGTNSVAVNTAQFRASAIKAANDLTVFIASLIPNVKIVQ